MSKYRKKPIVIEAREFTDSNGAELAEWCGGRLADAEGTAKPLLFVKTLEGEMTASPGDWIIRGVIGEFYPVKPEVFDATYEPADGQR